MLSRVFAASAILLTASIALGGVTVTLVPTSGMCADGLTVKKSDGTPSEVEVDVRVSQNPGGADQLARMLEFDLQATSSSLTVTTPLTHDRPGSPIHFWRFDSLAQCQAGVQFCGLHHYIDDDLPAGPVDTRANVLSIAFQQLSADSQYQLPLAASGTPITVGKLKVTMPPLAGLYNLNVVNAGDTDALNRRAREDHGFDPHITWRAGVAAPNDVSGGTFAFNVVDLCEGGEAAVSKWESVRPHEQGVGNVALEIPNTDVFSEPRTGVTQLVVTFTSAINPATATPANVVICGNNLANSAIDLSGITVTTAATAGNTKMEINFNPKLPNVGRYKVAISGVQSAGGGAVIAGSGGLSRIFTALQGDAGGAAGGQGDRRVNATDVGGCRNLALAAQSDPIDPALLLEVRCDANDDGRVNATDVGGIRGFALQGAPFDARNIDPPSCP